MLVASHSLVKEMILTHGECERLSIVLGVLVGVVCTGKEKKSSRARAKIGGYLTGSTPPLSEIPIRKSG